MKFRNQYSENDRKLPLHKINLELITIETINDRHNSQTSHLSTRTKWPQTKKYTFHLHVHFCLRSRLLLLERCDLKLVFAAVLTGNLDEPR